MENTIAILDASSASVTIKKLPAHLIGAQLEDIEEYFELDSSSDYIFGDLNLSIEL